MLVSVEELRRYMGGYEPDPGLEQEMVNILIGVQQGLEAYLNRPVELVQVREIAYSDSKGNLYLSVTPVQKVIAYGSNVGTATPLTTIVEPYEIEADPLIGDDGRIIDKVNDKHGRPDFRPWGFWTTYPNNKFVIEYVGGIDGRFHEEIKLAIKRVAAREYAGNFVNTAGIRIGNVEQVEVGDNRNPGWTRAELESLQRFRRRIVM